MRLLITGPCFILTGFGHIAKKKRKKTNKSMRRGRKRKNN
jgi:hypothetical protein